MPGTSVLSFILRFKQQGELDPPAPFDAGNNFSFPFSERHVFLDNIPVSALQLAYQFALGHFPASQQAVRPDLIGKAGKQDRVTPEAAEHAAQLPHIGTKQAVALCTAYLMGQPFARQELMPIPHVRQVLAASMPALQLMSSLS